MSFSGINVIGASENGALGYSTASAGDINGDGRDDFFLTAPFEELGVAYIIYGGVDLDAQIDLATLTTDQGFRIDGFESDDLSFAWVTEFVQGIGDFNNDGVDDIAVGYSELPDPIFGFDPITSVQIIYGKSGGNVHPPVIELDQIGIDDGELITGIDGTVNGISAGDLNGDGLLDLAISATSLPTFAGFDDFDDLGGFDLLLESGFAGFVVLGGQETGFTDVNLLDGSDGFAVEATLSSLGFDDILALEDLANTQLSIVGDVTGDGIDDLVLRDWALTTTVDDLFEVEGRQVDASGYLILGRNSGFEAVELIEDAQALDWASLGPAAVGGSEVELHVGRQLDMIELSSGNIASLSYPANIQIVGPDGTAISSFDIGEPLARNTAITALPGDQVVVAWAQYENGAQTIYMQVFESDGTPANTAAQVNVGDNFVANNDAHISVATDDAGKIVVAYNVRESAQSGTGIDVKARVFEADGTELVPEFRVNETETSTQWNPSVDFLSDGSMAFVYEDSTRIGFDDVTLRIFDANGVAATSDIAVALGAFGIPQIKSDANGGFVVASTTVLGVADDSSIGIEAIVYDNSGNVVTPVFQVNTQTDGAQRWIQLDQLDNGNFVITWDDNDFVNAPDDVNRTKAVILDSTGSVVVPEFEFPISVEGSHARPNVVALEDGGFFAAWEVDVASGPSITVGRAFDADGTPRAFGEATIELEPNLVDDVHVEMAGDINGDGYGDVAVVDERLDEISIFFGGPAGPASTTPDMVILGADLGAVAALGDVTGDGIDDLGVATTDSDDGAAHIILGKNDGTLPTMIDLNALDAAAREDAIYTIKGDGVGEGPSTALAGAGDVDGDGVNDIVFGAPYSGNGSGYILFGDLTGFEAVDNAAEDGVDDNILSPRHFDTPPVIAPDPVYIGFADNSFVISSQEEGPEGEIRSVDFTVQRTGNLDVEASVDWSVTGFGSADAEDFGGALPSGSFTFGVGEDFAFGSFDITGDNQIEPDELFDIQLNNPQAGGGAEALITDGTVFGEILNDDEPARISVNGFSNSEDSGSIFFTVERFGGFGSEVTVQYQIDGLGADSADVVGTLPISDSVILGPDEFEKTVFVEVVPDQVVEPSEGLTFSITSLSDNAVLQGSPSATAYIWNDDSPIFLFADAFGFESNQMMNVSFFRWGGEDTDITIDYTLTGDTFSGADFNDGLPILGSVTIPSGASFASEVLGVVDDTLVEFLEFGFLEITNVTTASGTTVQYNDTVTSFLFDNDFFPPPPPFGPEADVWGDPHIVTLDGLGYDFQAVGEYVLVESTLLNDPEPFEVQVRFEPLAGSDLISVTTRMSVSVAGQLIEIDALSPDEPLLINGVAVDQETLELGAIDLDNDGSFDVFIDTETNEFSIVLNSAGEQLKVKSLDGSLNVCVFLSDGFGGHSNLVQGLMGNANGDRSDDLALRDGTVLAQPVDFDVLYGIYASDWAVPEDARAFSDQLPDLPATFPASKITIDDLPEALLETAKAAVEAAGIDPDEDPVIFDAAVLDFALTSNADFIDGALGLAAEPQETTEPVNSPDLPLSVGTAAVQASVEEGDSGSMEVGFSLYRVGSTQGSIDISYEVTGAGDGDPIVGTATLINGQDTATVVASVIGDALFEVDEKVVLSITDVSNSEALLANTQASIDVINDDAAPVAEDDTFAVQEDDILMENIFAPNPSLGDGDADGDVLELVSITDSEGMETALAQGSASVTLPSGALLTVLQNGELSYDPDIDVPDGTIELDGFSYVVSDGNGNQASADVTINVFAIEEDDPVDDPYDPSNYSNLILGDEDRNNLTGTSDDDYIDGKENRDNINGLGGDDYIIAGPGTDWNVRGGEGADVFEYGLGDGVLKILDWEDGSDLIRLVDGLSFDDFTTSSFTRNGVTTTIKQLSSGERINFRGAEEQDITQDDFLEGDGVVDPNTPPVAIDDVAQTDQGVAVEIDVLTNDADAEDGVPLATSVQIVDADIDSGGRIKTVDGEGVWSVDGTSGAITFSPDNAFFGDATVIEYTVADSQGDRSAPAFVAVNVTPDPYDPSNYSNVILGDEDRNNLTGTSDDDYIDGKENRDNINGLGGDDYIIAGPGTNWNVRGGEGADVFEYGLGDGVLKILDWEDGSDLIRLVDGLSFDDFTTSSFTRNGVTTTIKQLSSGERIIFRGAEEQEITADDFVSSVAFFDLV